MTHHNSHESDLTRTFAEANQLIAAMSVIDVSVRERLPIIIAIGVQVHGIASRPIFDAILCGERHRPMNPNNVYRLACAQIDHRPLRMGVFRLASEMRIEIRIAFPKRVVIAVGNT